GSRPALQTALRADQGASFGPLRLSIPAAERTFADGNAATPQPPGDPDRGHDPPLYAARNAHGVQAATPPEPGKLRQSLGGIPVRFNSTARRDGKNRPSRRCRKT